MDSNTHSTQPRPLPHPVPSEPPASLPQLPALGWLAGLPAVLAALEAEDLDQLTDPALTADALALRRWADRLDGQ